MFRHLAAHAQDRDEQVPREEGKKEAPEEGDHERDPRRDPCSPDSRRAQLEDLRCGIQIALRTQDDNVLSSVGDPFHQPHVLRKVSAMRPFASAPPVRSRAWSMTSYRTTITGIDASSTMGMELETIPANPSGVIHIAAAARNNPIRPGRRWKPSSSKSGRPKKTP